MGLMDQINSSIQIHYTGRPAKMDEPAL